MKPPRASQRRWVGAAAALAVAILVLIVGSAAPGLAAGTQGDGRIAEAGPDRQVGVGSGIELYGSALAGTADSFRWRVLQAPPGSALGGTGLGRGGRRGPLENLGPQGNLAESTSPTSTLTPDLPGTYRLQLEVKTKEGATGTDEMTVTADPDPLVRIETMAKPEGQTRFGVRVGEQFYPDPGSSKDWLQVVALNPETLELISNRAYECPEATAHPLVTDKAKVKPCLDKLRADLEALKPAKGAPSPIVIVGSQPPNAGPITRTEPWQTQPPVGIEEVLYRFGLPAAPRWNHRDVPLLRGRFSAIGRFGGPSTRHENLDIDDLRETGAIDGYLAADNKGFFSTFESGEFVPFDTQAKGSGPLKNVMSIGSKDYAESYSPEVNGTRGGFQVVFVNRKTLATTSHFFGSELNSSPHKTPLTWMVNQIKAEVSSGNGVLAFIQTLGNPRIATNDSSPIWVSELAKEVVDLLSENFGATRTRAYRALDEGLAAPDSSYRLIATEATKPGQGLEAEGPSVKDMNGVPARGYLTRSPANYEWEVATSDEGGAEADSPGNRLRRLAFSPTGHWPEYGNAGRTAAMAWVTKQVGLDTRRSRFWTEPFSSGYWGPKETTLQGLTCPEQPQGFDCASDFTWARKELLDEIGWVQTTHAYVEKLAKPFHDKALTSWADVKEVATRVNQMVQAPATDKAVVKAGLLFQMAADLGEELPVAGKAIGAINDLYKLGLEWAKVDSEGTDAGQPFSTSVAQAGSALAERLQAIDNTLEVRLFKALVADYRKLRTVGLCGGNIPTCPDGPLEAWEYKSVEQERAAPIIKEGVEGTLYSALLPARFRAYGPAVSPYRSMDYSGHQPAGQTIFGWECPFHTEPATAQLALPIYRNVSGKGKGGPDRWQVVAFAYRTGSGVAGDPWKMHLPEAALTDRLFNSPVDGGLGLFPESFFRDAFGGTFAPFDAPGFKETEGAFPLRESQVRWISQSDPIGFKLPSCGY